MSIDSKTFQEFLKAFFLTDLTDLVEKMIQKEAIDRTFIEYPTEFQQIYVKHWFYVDIHVYPDEEDKIVNSLHKHCISYINYHGIYFIGVIDTEPKILFQDKKWREFANEWVGFFV